MLSLAILTYFGIAAGVGSQNGKFWSSFMWPEYVGKILFHEAKKRGLVE